MHNAIVTGGTGALGQAVVRVFLEAGHRVVVPWIAEGERDRLRAEHESAVVEKRLVTVEADIAEEAGARAVVEAAGEIHVLINGAGGFAGGRPVAETALDDWDRMYRINLRTAVAMTRAALPAMAEPGAILFVAATAVRSTPAGLAAYVASKAGIVALVQTLAHELDRASVRVNAVAPTTIDTPANRAAMPDADRSSWTPPLEIARTLLWLASDEATAVHGAIVPV